MKRFHVSELTAAASGHLFSSVVSGKYIWDEAAVEFRRPGETIPPAAHDDEEIYLILQGKARVRLDTGVEHLCAGEGMVIEPGETHEFVSDEDEPCVQMYLHCGPQPHPNQAS